MSFSTAIRIGNERARWLISHGPEQGGATFLHSAPQFCEQFLFLCAHPSDPRASGYWIVRQSIDFLAPRRLYAEADHLASYHMTPCDWTSLKTTLVWFVQEIIVDEKNRVPLVLTSWQQFVQLAFDCRLCQIRVFFW
jgi:hypothetical protein